MFFLLLLAASTTADNNSYLSDYDEDQHLILKKAILIEPNYTGLDCYFNKNEECYWTWDADNYTESSSDQQKPGQNGFIQLGSEDMKRFHNKWPKQFFGPYTDARNYEGKSRKCGSNAEGT